MPSAHRFGYLRAMRLDALSSTRKQRPMMAGLIRELVKRVPFDLAAAVEKNSSELLTELESSTVPELPAEDAAA